MEEKINWGQESIDALNKHLASKMSVGRAISVLIEECEAWCSPDQENIEEVYEAIKVLKQYKKTL